MANANSQPYTDCNLLLGKSARIANVLKSRQLTSAPTSIPGFWHRRRAFFEKEANKLLLVLLKIFY